MKTNILFVLLAISFIAGGNLKAQKTITTYHDYKKTKKSEVFQVDASGEKNGPYKSYDERGALKSQGNYKNDKKVGKWTYSNGVTTNIETYDDQGNKNGLWLIYCVFNYKVKSEEGTYKNNKKDGVWTEYYCASETNEQKLKSKETFVNGEVDGFCTYIDEDGFKQEGIVKGIQRIGEWRFYDNGKLVKTRNYVDKGNGISSVDEIAYYDNGKVAAKRKAEDQFLYTGMGKSIKRLGLIGEELFYDTTGVLSAKNIWTSKTKGKHEEYFQDGKLSATCDVEFDDRNGQTVYRGHVINYYLNGNKKNEYDFDRYGNMDKSTYYEYLESGEPTEATKQLMQNKK
jgi:antitoxin component YwqK of YwqJK toxin-antitoxin module